ncbi:MAG TPA: hypothetical protein DCQ11_02660, partial [Gammaproteobacteria bacterium]|nr:hypothetical protein [Gammaproteobacteria bacterium]
ADAIAHEIYRHYRRDLTEQHDMRAGSHVAPCASLMVDASSLMAGICQRFFDFMKIFLANHKRID